MRPYTAVIEDLSELSERCELKEGMSGWLRLSLGSIKGARARARRAGGEQTNATSVNKLGLPRFSEHINRPVCCITAMRWCHYKPCVGIQRA